jgi:hypothetical protein
VPAHKFILFHGVSTTRPKKKITFHTEEATGAMYVITQINTYYMRLTTNENGYDNYWWGMEGIHLEIRWP